MRGIGDDRRGSAPSDGNVFPRRLDISFNAASDVPFARRSADIKENSEPLDPTRSQIRFTTAGRVLPLICSAHFIVITQTSEERDIFTPRPGGDECVSLFFLWNLEGNASGRRGRRRQRVCVCVKST